MGKRVKLAGKSRVVFAVVRKRDQRLISCFDTRDQARHLARMWARDFRVQRGIFVPKGRA